MNRLLWVVFGLYLSVAAVGALLLARQLPRWLARENTTALMVISLFGGLHFAATAAAQGLYTGAALLLGPFALFVTGIADTLLRTTVLVTLLTLLPRAGVVALAHMVSWLLRATLFGQLDAVGFVQLVVSIGLLEALLWATGLTRHRAWLDQSINWRWARLALAFGTATGLASVLSLASAMVVYRLYYTGAYLAALVLLPGVIYPSLACGPATRFAHRLRAVQP